MLLSVTLVSTCFLPLDITSGDIFKTPEVERAQSSLSTAFPFSLSETVQVHLCAQDFAAGCAIGWLCQEGSAEIFPWINAWEVHQLPGRAAFRVVVSYQSDLY